MSDCTCNTVAEHLEGCPLHDAPVVEAKCMRCGIEFRIGIPPGYALVPVEPTPEMLRELFKPRTYTVDADPALIYRAMLAAAPSAPAPDQPSVDRARLINLFTTMRKDVADGSGLNAAAVRSIAEIIEVAIGAPVFQFTHRRACAEAQRRFPGGPSERRAFLEGACFTNDSAAPAPAERQSEVAEKLQRRLDEANSAYEFCSKDQLFNIARDAIAALRGGRTTDSGPQTREKE